MAGSATERQFWRRGADQAWGSCQHARSDRRIGVTGRQLRRAGSGRGRWLRALLTGLLALKAVNPAGADGLLAGNPAQFLIQLKAAGFTLLWVGVGTFVILQVLRMLMPLRASDAEERQGLGINAHGEEAYNTEFTG